MEMVSYIVNNRNSLFYREEIPNNYILCNSMCNCLLFSFVFPAKLYDLIIENAGH